MMDACYKITLEATCESPLLPNVDYAIILTMTNSDRRKGESFKQLFKICKKTYVQENKGFKYCKKPDWVNHSGRDLIHANKNACLFSENDDNVLILEDDAEILTPLCRDSFYRVNDFVKNNKTFDAYSLGSLCAGVLPSTLYHHLCVRPIGAQAMILSKKVRESLLIESLKDMHHIDSSFYSFKRVYTFYKPLVVQKFPKTENRSNWCTFCNTKLKTFDNKLNNLTQRVFDILKLQDENTHWTTIYILQSAFVPVYILFLGNIASLYLSRSTFLNE